MTDNADKHENYLGIAAGLAVIGAGGCLAVYSARAYGENPLYFALRQLVWLAAGLAVFLPAARIPFRIYRKYALHLAGAAALALLAVLFFGTRINGMRGWFPLPGDFSIQPSELAKAPYLLLLAVIAEKRQWTEKRKVAALWSTAALFCGLVLPEPDLGTATVFAGGLLIVMTAAGFRKRWIFCSISAMLAMAAGFALLHPYAQRRIAAFLDPDADFYGAGWHIRQFRLTLANGGWFGSDEGGALWASAYLPLSHSDSAFAAIVESSGFAGGMLILGGFVLAGFLFRKLALGIKDPAAGLFLFSAGAMIVFQGLLHIGVNVTLLPTTGLTMPVFSYGGSSLLGVMLLLGMAFSGKNGKPEQS